MEEEDVIISDGKPKKPSLGNFLNSKNLLIFSVIVIILILLYFAWIFIFGQYQGCKSWECFNENLAACKKTRFAGGTDIIFGYQIEGKSGKNCEVTVEFIQGEIPNKEAKELTGKTMTCSLPQGVIMLPESDLSRCTGPLKEKLQEQIISQLHNFIVQNLGQINKELLNPLNYQDSKDK